MGQYVNLYCENENQKLKGIVDFVLSKFGGINQCDYDDFYSLAAVVCWKCEEEYDQTRGIPFEPFFRKRLSNKIKTMITARNRDKRTAKIEVVDEDSGEIRKIPIPDVRLDAPVGEDGLTIGDVVASNFDLDKQLNEVCCDLNDEKVERYLKSLSKIQTKIAKLVMIGCSAQEIKDKLNITSREYISNWNDMKSFNKVLLLKKCESNVEEEEMKINEIQTTMEKSKPGRLSIASINKKIDKHTIRFDHPLQRESDQWTTAMKSNLISDIAQGNPIPPLVFAEQVVNGIAIIWDLDGKQRCTNVYSFVHDGFKISKNVRRFMIQFQTPQKGIDGKDVFDEEGFPVYESHEFDIRGRKFSQFPEELQEKILDYNFEITQYLNCSSEDIAYHIARYNEGKPMNASQKSLTRLSENFAVMVKSISNMEFFRDRGGYKVSEFNNGTMQRVIVESIMAANYLDNWKKKPEDMCEFLSDNVTETVFEDFESMVNKLTDVITDETANMFDSKDSFLWFGLYARFQKVEEDGNRFVDFMAEFAQSLHSKLVGEISYDDLNSKSTKDRAVIIAKLDLLEKLMLDYLDISENNISPADFIKENVASDVTGEDIEFCEDMLMDLSLNVDNNSKLLSDENHVSLMGIVVYAFKNDIDLDNWFIDYFKANTTFLKNQKENYLHMVDSLNNYIAAHEKISA
ncbi:MAG: hypothetical protein LUH21_04385 [Clostridiales bacterium]|nr:hypothetical protein [Clostridiales bacterium]